MTRPATVAQAHAALIALGSSEPALKAMQRLYAFRVAEEMSEYSQSEMADFLLDGCSAINAMSAEDLADALTDDLMFSASLRDEEEDAIEEAESLVAEFTAHVAEAARRKADRVASSTTPTC